MKLLNRKAGPQGGMLLVAASFLVLMAALAAVVMTSTASTANRLAETKRQQVRARYLGQGALELIEQQVRDQVFDSYVEGGSAVYLLESIDAVEGLLEQAGSITVGETEVSYRITELDGHRITKTEDGLQAIMVPIEVEATVLLPGVEHHAHRMLRATFVPAYQFAVFFDMDFELWPGPDMTLGGPVHSNGDMWLGAGSSLTFDTNYVRCTGKLYQGRPHKSDTNTKPLRFRRWVEDPYDGSEPVEFGTLPTKDDYDAEGITSNSGLDSLFNGYDADGDDLFLSRGDESPFASAALELFSQPELYSGDKGFTLQTGDHGVEPIAMPDLASTSMFLEVDAGVGDYVWDADSESYVETTVGDGTHRKGPFHESAGLSILLHEDGSWQAFDGEGIDVTTKLGGVVTKGSLPDVREGEDVTTAVVDVAALGASGHFPSNGLLYMGAYGDTPLDGSKGFVLTGGEELPAPLTTVTENFLYVDGDYNTIAKKPSSVIADVVNLLSNDWDGTKTLSSGKPTASATTYNVAIVAGNRESVWGKRFAGGFENFVRFHENWSGVECSITGSFVSLGEPVYSYTTLNGSAYSPPKRRWEYETDFNDLAKLPPFTPCFLNFEGVVDW